LDDGGAVRVTRCGNPTSTTQATSSLIATLLDELNIDATFTELVGRPAGLATRKYPQAIAVALSLRHSWRREELVKFAKRFGVKLTTKDLSDTASTDTADAPAPDAEAMEHPKHPFIEEPML
jgi:hypothetical protein